MQEIATSGCRPPRNDTVAEGWPQPPQLPAKFQFDGFCGAGLFPVDKTGFFLYNKNDPSA